jgi:outer membrane protein TolC
MFNPRFWCAGVLIVLLASGGARAEEKVSRLKELLKEKVAALKEAAALVEKAHQSGAAPLEQVQQANRAVLDAELELCDNDKERIAVLEKIVALTRQQEEQARELEKKSALPAGAVIAARVRRIDAEIVLERAKARQQAGRENARSVVELAESELEMWKERVAWSERMVKKGYLTERQLQTERAALKQAETVLEKARRELDGVPPKDKPK